MAKVTGLDIGTFSIKAVQLTKKGKNFRLEKIGIELNPTGELIGENEEAQNKVAETVKTLLGKLKLSGTKVVTALSESQVYSRVVEMPSLSDSELASAIHWEAEQFIPVPIDQVNIDYEVIFRPSKNSPEEKMQIFLVAAPKNIIERMLKFAEKCNIQIVGLETEIIAVTRAVINEQLSKESLLVLHFGASNTNLAVIKNNMPLLIHNIEIGGGVLTRQMSNELGLEYSQAEEYKRSYGLEVQYLEGKVSESLSPLIDRILSEVKKAIHAYNSINQKNLINRVIMSGGSSLLPYLVTYVAQYLGTEVVLANAFSMVEPSNNCEIPLDKVSFATAVGLAMREL